MQVAKCQAVESQLHDRYVDCQHVLRPTLARPGVWLQRPMTITTRFNLTALASSANKVLFGVIYLREAAADWFQPYLTNFLENNDPTDRETKTNTIFND